MLFFDKWQKETLNKCSQIGALPQSWTSTEKTKSPMVFAIEVGDEEGNIERAKDGVTPTASPQANILKQPDSHLSMHHPGNKKQEKSQGPLVRVGEKNEPELVEKMVILLPNFFSIPNRSYV